MTDKQDHNHAGLFDDIRDILRFYDSFVGFVGLGGKNPGSLDRFDAFLEEIRPCPERKEGFSPEDDWEIRMWQSDMIELLMEAATEKKDV